MSDRIRKGSKIRGGVASDGGFTFSRTRGDYKAEVIYENKRTKQVRLLVDMGREGTTTVMVPVDKISR